MHDPALKSCRSAPGRQLSRKEHRSPSLPPIRFFVPPARHPTLCNEGRDIHNEQEYRWATFYAVVYHTDLAPIAMSFWRETGDGITSRHAEYALGMFQFLKSQSDSKAHLDELQNASSLPPPSTTAAEITSIKSLIATSAASDSPGHAPIRLDDVFLYSKGLAGIYAVARSLVPRVRQPKTHKSWPYAETVKCVERSGWGNVILYGKGTEADLDELEQRLANGVRIQALFCELPSNPQLASPDLHRIRALADQYKFVVACDETLGTFVNVDVLPYVDIVMTSLTKIFSGAADVMGGSVIVNPDSPFYESIHGRLAKSWEDVLFPGDIAVLARNCPDFVERVQYCCHGALAVANLVSQSSLVATVYYPSLVPSRHLYERYRRENGGYGYVLSIIFHEPARAVAFYDALDVCKGTSIGANFTLAVPYSQLAHFRELDWAEANGVPKHIVRISVGIDDTEKLLNRVVKALEAAQNVSHAGRAENVSSL
ncbi:hypothetical protein N7470_008915 [Penicillium chermesinum]|nr:hypothetical protein N7470_008915 [Penicillium chermesinum]